MEESGQILFSFSSTEFSERLARPDKNSQNQVRKWGGLAQSIAQIFYIQSHNEFLHTIGENLNFRTLIEMHCTIEEMSIHPCHTIKLFFEMLCTTANASKNRMMNKCHCCRVHDYIILIYM